MESDFMGQKELCKLSRARIEQIKKSADSIKTICDNLDPLFADVNNFAYINYLETFAEELENARKSILASNGTLIRVQSDALRQKDIASQAKKK
jgi:hypothetical protein